MLFTCLSLLLVLSRLVSGVCYEQNPAFPPPDWKDLASELKPAFAKIEHKLHEIISKDIYETTSYSVEVTSSVETLWGNYGTARKQNETRPGVRRVDSVSQYRIASITKVFTVLGILHQQKAGKLNLDDPVIKYIDELNSDAYKLPWKDITLRALASQLSGIPREFAQSDLLNSHNDPISIGLPPASKDSVPQCDEYNDYRPCNRTELLNGIKRALPLFAPNQRSTYSNLNYELLGLVLANVTGISYEDSIKTAIFEPLGLSSTSFDTPSDEHAVLPLVRNGRNYWDVNEGVQNPTGGIYSSSADLSKFLRYILTHYNALATGVNWLMPASWAMGMHSFYGMPFEIFRTEKILPHSKRPVTFTTKSGGLPGYFSRILILEDYGLGITVLVGGEVSLVLEILETVSIELVRAAEEVIWRDVSKTHTGSFVAIDANLNSSLTLGSSASKGLYLDSFISNGTDVFTTVFPIFVGDLPGPWFPQLIPTLLYEDEKNQRGEIWRVIVVHERPKDGDPERYIWEDECITDVDTTSYAGKPINKIIFWHERGEVELPAWNVTMKLATDGSSDKQSSNFEGLTYAGDNEGHIEGHEDESYGRITMEEAAGVADFVIQGS